MNKKERRLEIFRYGSAGIAKYTGGDSSLYYCPICRSGYPETSAVAGTDLTLEDVPPKSVGGKPILLTCRQCNSSAGHKIDASTASKKKFEKFEGVLCGHEKATVSSVILSMANVDIKTSVCTERGFDVKPQPNANSPAAMEIYRKHLKSLVTKGPNEFNFKLSMTQKYDHRLYKLSQLKSAFLLLFAWLGYGYAFDPRLAVVRHQIQEPEQDILGTRFWIKGGECMPSHKILFLRTPLPVFLVSFDGFSIILPSLESSGDIYDILPNYWEKDQRINLELEVLLERFPDKLQMKLDYSK